MNGNSSMMTDKDRTFFEEYKPKTSRINMKDCTKNSSNPERVYGELESEISRVIGRRASEKVLEESIVSSASPSETANLNEDLIDKWIKNYDKDETQDSNQLSLNFYQLKSKEKQTPKNKDKKPKTQFINNPLLQDYSVDTEEFSKEDLDENITALPKNLISSIKIKTNNIFSIENNSEEYLRRGYCVSEPAEEVHRRFASQNGSFCNGNTPQKMRGSFAWAYNENCAPNFPTILSRKSIVSNISTQFSSNNPRNHNLINFEEDGSVDLVKVGVSPYETNDDKISQYEALEYQNLHSTSDRKVRLLTSESIESSHSNMTPHLVGLNLNNQFSPMASSMPYICFDQGMKRQFSASFNENNNYAQLENAFSINSMRVNQGQRPNIGRHQKSLSLIKEDLQMDKFYEVNLDDISSGRDNRTTIMVRNIPIKYNENEILMELIEFKDKFDCIYIPWDYENDGNRGYFFINFVHPLHILLFYEKFEGRTWNNYDSKKICELNYGRFQGLKEINDNARRYKGEKKPSYFQISNRLSNIVIPMKYRGQIKLRFPSAQFEDIGYGLIKVTLFSKKFIY